MSWKEYKELMVDEWRFHKRHPEMFLIWIMIAWALVLAIRDICK